MLKLIKNFQNASPEVKRFVLTIISIGIILVVTTVYSYFRLTG